MQHHEIDELTSWVRRDARTVGLKPLMAALIVSVLAVTLIQAIPFKYFYWIGLLVALDCAVVEHRCGKFKLLPAHMAALVAMNAHKETDLWMAPRMALRTKGYLTLAELDEFSTEFNAHMQAKALRLNDSVQILIG